MHIVYGSYVIVKNVLYKQLQRWNSYLLWKFKNWVFQKSLQVYSIHFFVLYCFFYCLCEFHIPPTPYFNSLKLRVLFTFMLESFFFNMNIRKDVDVYFYFYKTLVCPEILSLQLLGTIHANTEHCYSCIASSLLVWQRSRVTWFGLNLLTNQIPNSQSHVTQPVTNHRQL